jgi:hypothetical protein
MRIEKNYSLPALTREDILLSPVKMKPVTACLTRNPPLSNKLYGLTVGKFMVFSEGLAFLTNGKKFSVANALGASGDIAGEFANITSNISPLVGVATSLLLSRKKPNINKKVDEMLNHPETFVIPLTSIVEISGEPVGNFLTRRYYIVMLVENESHQLGYYAVISSQSDRVFSPGEANTIMYFRFLSEKSMVERQIYNELFNLDKVRNEMTPRMIEKFPGQNDKSIAEMQTELDAYLHAQMSANNVTEADINSLLRERLKHFTPMLNNPAFAKVMAKLQFLLNG